MHEAEHIMKPKWYNILESSKAVRVIKFPEALPTKKGYIAAKGPKIF